MKKPICGAIRSKNRGICDRVVAVEGMRCNQHQGQETRLTANQVESLIEVMYHRIIRNLSKAEATQDETAVERHERQAMRWHRELVTLIKAIEPELEEGTDAQEQDKEAGSEFTVLSR